MYSILFSINSLLFALICAKIEPIKFCITEKIAPGRAANGFNAKFVFAKTTASPAFCVPTSIERVELLS